MMTSELTSKTCSLSSDVIACTVVTSVSKSTNVVAMVTDVVTGVVKLAVINGKTVVSSRDINTTTVTLHVDLISEKPGLLTVTFS
jgi:hypothetical protein